MALVRRHWKLFCFNVAILILFLGVLVWRLLERPQPLLAAGTEPPAPPAQSAIDAATYTQVRELRLMLGITNENLASLGCSREQAGQLLTAVLGWARDNATVLGLREAAVTSAQAAYRDGLQKVGMGTGDEVESQLAQLRSALSTALADRKTLLDGAAAVVQPVLTTEQRGMWQAVRANRSLPSHYRFVPGLTASEGAALQLVVSRYGRASEQVQSVEQSVLTGNRPAAIAAAASNASTAFGGVVEADRETLPRPTN